MGQLFLSIIIYILYKIIFGKKKQRQRGNEDVYIILDNSGLTKDHGCHNHATQDSIFHGDSEW